MMINSYWKDRRQRLVTAGVITPADVSAWYPFTRPEYSWGREINFPEMGRLRSTDPRVLMIEDPYVASPIRSKRGDVTPLGVWDSVLGIPACKWRSSAIRHPRYIASLYGGNTTWGDSVLPALQRMGRIDGEYVRPEHPAIFDFASIEDGWKYLELAHALSHLYSVPAEDNMRGANHTHMLRWLAHLVICTYYAIPLKIPSDRDTTRSADIAYLGIDISISGAMRSPNVLVPVTGALAPIPDTTVAIYRVGVHIEPHPYGITGGSGKWIEINRWACMPTIISLSGWECVDVVTKHGIYSYNENSKLANEFYGMSVHDLASPETFNNLVDKARDHGRVPEPDGHLTWMVPELLRSEAYNALIAVSPPLPCKECVKLNARCEGAPGRPKGHPPPKRPKAELEAIREGRLIVDKDEKSWIDWTDAIDRTLDLVERSVDYWQGNQMGHTAYKRFKRRRKAAHSKRLALLKRIEVLKRRRSRELRGGRLSGLPVIDTEIEQVKQEIAHLLGAIGDNK